MNVLTYHSTKRKSSGWLRWCAAALALTVAIIAIATASVAIVAIAAALAITTVTAIAFRFTKSTPSNLDARHFTPPYGTPVVRDPQSQRPRNARASGSGRAPGRSTHNYAIADKVGVGGGGGGDLDSDSVGQLVHGLRSTGYATFRAKSRPDEALQPALKTGKTDVFIRDDRHGANTNSEAVKAEVSPTALLTFLSGSVHDAGFKHAGWTVVSAQNAPGSSRWSAILKNSNGETVTLNLVSPKVFSAAIRGTTHAVENTQEHAALNFTPELNRSSIRGNTFR